MITLAPPAERSLPALLAERARSMPDRPFLRDRDGTLTFSETREQTLALAGGLRALGLGHGDRVALLVARPREAVLSWLATGLLGAVEVPINPELFGDRLRYMLEHSGSKVVIVDDHLVARIDELAGDLHEVGHVVVIGGGAAQGIPSTTFAELLRSVALEDPAPTDPADLAALLYTSGSTGMPKAVMVPHGQHYMNAFQAARAAGIAPDDVSYLCLPLHHNMAQGYGIAPALLAGACVHLGGKFDRRTFWHDITESGATVFPFVGAMLALLAAQEDQQRTDEPRLRVGYGIPVSRTMHQNFGGRFGIRLVHCYGSTEATIVTWGGVDAGHEAQPGSCGWVVPEFVVEVHDETDRPVPVGEIGEICIRPTEPASMFGGYYADPERTLAVIRNLWFHTGDQGRFDEGGELWFVGRNEDVIRRFGEFIAASDVEEAFAAHPSVEQAVAFGVASDVVGEEVMVVVTLRHPEAVDGAELWAWGADKLPRFAVPRFVEIVDELPMTATGKTQKNQIRSVGPTSSTFDARLDGRK